MPGITQYHFDRAYFDAPMEIESFILYQIGRRYCLADSRVERHIQRDYIELTVVTGGCGTVYTNDHPEPIGEGDIHVSFPGDFHEIVSSCDNPLRYDYISIKCMDPLIEKSIDKVIGSYYAPCDRIIRNSRITELLTVTIGEVGERTELSDKLLSSLISEMMIYMVREFEKTQSAKYGRDVSERELFCYNIMSYIDSHIYSIRSLTELSEVFCYNYNYLSNIFSEVSGETLSSYYRGRRMKIAEMLLGEQGMSVSEVATLLNYSSVYTFSRAFKERYGYPPSKVKKNGGKHTV